MLFCDICKTKVFPSVFGACSQCHAQTVGGCSICFPCALQTGALSFRQCLMFEGKCASCGSSFSSPTKTTEIVAQAPAPNLNVQSLPTDCDMVASNAEWSNVFVAAGISDIEIRTPPFRLAVLRQIYKTNYPANLLPSLDVIPDLAWLITDLARLAKLLRQNPVTCPASHALYSIKTSDLCSENANYSNGFMCDVCKSRSAIPAIAMHCAVCQYDLCANCALVKILS